MVDIHSLWGSHFKHAIKTNFFNFFFCVLLSDDIYLDLINRRWEVPVPRAIEVIYSSSSGEGTDPRFVKLAPVFRCSMLKCGDKKRYCGDFPAIKNIIY